MTSLTSCSCPTMPAEAVYLGRSNAISYVLREGGVAIADLSAVTRVVAEIGDTEIDSDVVGSSVIWWTDQVEYKGEMVDHLQMILGGQALTPGSYTMSITVYSIDWPAGILWDSEIPVSVVTA